MKSGTLIIGIIGIIILSCIQTSFSQDKDTHRTKIGSEKCGSIIEGQQFCVTSDFISANLGEVIPLKMTMQNLTQKTIISSPQNRDFYFLFNVTITDSIGNKILSNQEMLLEKFKNKTISEEELGQLLPLHSGQTYLIEPNQKLKLEYGLGYFYKFEAKGKYFVKIARKISDKEILTVELEIN
ncbi:MAG: hypothetical protein K1X72_10465 [Pyrinomonadaceae bacterium]|nr:hypothetical protein [Pyrinomonadaceae bacterium]